MIDAYYNLYKETPMFFPDSPWWQPLITTLKSYAYLVTRYQIQFFNKAAMILRIVLNIRFWECKVVVTSRPQVMGMQSSFNLNDDDDDLLIYDSSYG
jgi:hypothetical protein